ncbi:MAG: hypothetical protein MUC64_11935 [Rubritepida sp.]|nr:hypothetical protein [Rubritepida sp.]
MPARHGFLRGFGVTLCLLALPGCIIPLPQGEGEVTEGREISDAATLAAALVGTERAVLIARLGEPQAIWEERSILVYAWDRVHLKLLWIIAGGLRAAGGIIDVPTHYLLLVALDDQGRVARAERCVRPLNEGFGDFLRAWADGRRCP